MLAQDYAARRAKLVSEFNRLKRMGLKLSAKARIRKIADLDYDYDRIPKEKTKQIFGYYEL